MVHYDRSYVIEGYWLEKLESVMSRLLTEDTAHKDQGKLIQQVINSVDEFVEQF